MSWKQKFEDDGMLKIECIVPILENCEYSDQFTDAIDEMDAKEYCRLTKVTKKDAEELFEERGMAAQTFKEIHYGKLLCKVATPKVAKSGMFSWGHTVLDTIVAKDMDDLIEQGLKFVEKYGKDKK